MLINYHNLVYIEKGANKEMIYFVISYLALFMLLLSSFFIKSAKTESRKKFINELRPLWILLMIGYAIIGVITKDPFFTDLLCNGWKVCYPPTYEWIAYVTIIAVSMWAVILKPMSNDIKELKSDGTRIECRLNKVEGTLEVVKTNTDKLIEFNLNKKK